MDKELQQYIDALKDDIKRYEHSTLETKPFLETMEAIDKWLEEKKDANPRN